MKSLRTRLFAGLLLLLPAVLSWGSAGAAEEVTVDEVLDAMGGADRLAAVETVSVEAEGSGFSHMYNRATDGPAQHLSDDRTAMLWQPRAGRFRVHIALDAFHPFQGEWEWHEAFDGRIATRAGPRDYRPDGDGTLAAAFVGAAAKRLALAHPQWLLLEATSIVPAGTRRFEGRDLPLLLVRAFDEIWRMAIDPESNLPHAVEVMEADGLMGEIPVRAEYRDWRAADGVMTPFRVTQFVDDRLNRREIRISVRYDAIVAEGDFRLAAPATPSPVDESLRRWGWESAHWFNDRAAMARPTEIRQHTPVSVEEVGEGVFQLLGTAHNSLAIVGAHSIALVEAPLGPERSHAMRTALAERFPGKPVRHLILTHHHVDHSAGLAVFVEGGARLVVGASDAAFYAGAIRRNLGRSADILAVSARTTLSGFDRPVELLAIPNSHAEGMIAVHVADADLLFVTDLFSAGREQQNPLMAGELFSALAFEGLRPAWLVGGHGRGRVPFDSAAEAWR